MDKQTIAIVVTVILVMAPVVATSYLMTAKSPKIRMRGYYALSCILFLFTAGFFAFAVSEGNKAGFVWMAPLAYGSYWAFQKAKENRPKV